MYNPLDRLQVVGEIRPDVLVLGGDPTRRLIAFLLVSWSYDGPPPVRSVSLLVSREVALVSW